MDSEFARNDATKADSWALANCADPHSVFFFKNTFSNRYIYCWLPLAILAPHELLKKRRSPTTGHMLSLRAFRSTILGNFKLKTLDSIPSARNTTSIFWEVDESRAVSFHSTHSHQRVIPRPVQGRLQSPQTYKEIPPSSSLGPSAKTNWVPPVCTAFGTYQCDLCSSKRSALWRMTYLNYTLKIGFVPHR